MGFWDKLKDMWDDGKEEVAKEASKQAAKHAAKTAAAGASAAASTAFEKAKETAGSLADDFLSMAEGELEQAKKAREGRVTFEGGELAEEMAGLRGVGSENEVVDGEVADVIGEDEPDEAVEVETSDAVEVETSDAVEVETADEEPSTPVKTGADRSLGWARRQREEQEASAVDELERLKAELDAQKKGTGGEPKKRNL